MVRRKAEENWLSESMDEKDEVRTFAADASRDGRLPVLGRDGKFRSPGDLEGRRRLVRDKKKTDTKTTVDTVKKRRRNKPDEGSYKMDGADGADEGSYEMDGADEVEYGQEREPAVDVESVRDRIAALAMAVTRNPVKNIRMMDALRKLRTDKSLPREIRALVMASEAQVYTDIAPGYVIRAMTEEERKLKVSKEVLKTRQYEQQLRELYEKFVREVVKTSTRHEDEDVVTAGGVLSALLSSLPHFNSSKIVADAVVSNLDSRNERISTSAATAVASLLSEAHRAPENVLAVAIACAEGIADLAEKRKHRLANTAVEPLLSLRIGALIRAADVAEAREDGDSGAGMKSRKQRRRDSKNRPAPDYEGEKQLKRDLMMAEAETSSVARRKASNRLLRSVCLTYIRVLHNAPSTPTALSHVLRGINDVAAMLEPEIVSALVDAISPLVADQTLPIRSSFEAITAFYTLLNKQKQKSGNDSIEPTELDRLLEKALRRIAAESWKVTDDLAKDVCTAVTAGLRGRKGDPEVWAAIGRRLLLAAVSSPIYSAALAFLSAGRLAHPNRRSCVEFNPEALLRTWNPDEEEAASGSANTSAWELIALTHYFHPTVAKIASDFFAPPPPRSDPLILLQEHSYISGGFNPKVQRTIINKTKKKARRAKMKPLYSPDEPLPVDFALHYYFHARIENARQAFEQSR